MSQFHIQTDQYQGPFDALLTMISKKKLHISQVSLSEIADDYITYVRNNEFSLKDASSFVVVAATLAYIKSKALLPTFQLTDQEEEDAEELQKRLQLYKLFTEIGTVIEKKIFKNTMYVRIFRIAKKQIVFTPDPIMTIENIEGAYTHVLSREREESEYTPKASVDSQMTLKEVLEHISTRIKRFVRAQFRELAVGKDPKSQAVSFLAVLELYKQGYVDLSQEEHFGPIHIENMQIDTPHY